MNEISAAPAKEAKQPEDQQDYDDKFKHEISPLELQCQGKVFIQPIGTVIDGTVSGGTAIDETLRGIPVASPATGDQSWNGLPSATGGVARGLTNQWTRRYRGSVISNQ